ncbi:MAG: DUF2171 domain-containing protein [Chloroflexi bacterium]|nr:DUF2171 domain-containing protein [Chloroflexota bacterium]
MADPVSDRLYLGRIVPGMDVCDVTGEKVGSISHIYRIDENTMTEPASRNFEEIIEVSSGFLGLGKRYYIPMSAIQEVLTDSVFISKSREAFGELGFEEKPAHLASLT